MNGTDFWNGDHPSPHLEVIAGGGEKAAKPRIPEAWRSLQQELEASRALLRQAEQELASLKAITAELCALSDQIAAPGRPKQGTRRGRRLLRRPGSR